MLSVTLIFIIELKRKTPKNLDFKGFSGFRKIGAGDGNRTHATSLEG